MRIALSNLDIAWEDKASNKHSCERLCQYAHQNGADLVIFPEMSLTGFSMSAVTLAEAPYESATRQYFSCLAKKYKLNIIFGYIAVAGGGVFFNRAEALNREGESLGVYDKIHAFLFAGEDRVYTPGGTLCVVDIEQTSVGLTICYDLRFPQLYSALADKCSLVVNIANWPAARVDHWYTLLKARAIENQYAVVGVNRIGVDGKGLEYQPSSCGYGPSGQTMLAENFNKALVLLDFDAHAVSEYRSSFPTLPSRRGDVYEAF